MKKRIISSGGGVHFAGRRVGTYSLPPGQEERERGYPPVLNPSSSFAHDLILICLRIPFMCHDHPPPSRCSLGGPHYGPADGDEEQDGEQSPQDPLQYEGLLHQ